jgi:asparagine synthase (glutamine-hydrolysing)
VIRAVLDETGATLEAGASRRVSRHVDGAVVVVADARIDQAESIDGPNAAAIVAAAYRRWGTDAARHLVGDFAFVVWDGCVLYAARDHLGIRSLHVRRHGATLRVASQPHALFDGDEGKRPDALAVGLFLVESYEEDDGYTLYEGVQAVAPGHQLVARGTSLRHESYWAPPMWRRARRESDAAYAARFSQVFREAVACRMRSESRLGVEVSGGLDSSSVAGQAAELARERGVAGPVVLHMDYPDRACNETHFSDAVAARWGLEVHNVVPRVADSAPAIHRDQPDALYCPLFATFTGLVSRAREQGIDAVMTGVGGDHVLDETTLECADALRDLHLGDAITTAGITRTPLALRPYKHLWSHGLKQLIPAPLRRATRPLRCAVQAFRSAPAAHPLTPEAARRCHAHVDARLRRDEALPFPSLAMRSFLQDLRRQTARIPMKQADLLGERFGVEYRYPFFDVRVVELMMSLPPEVRLRAGVTKGKPLLRRAMASRLPEAVLRRTDCGLYGHYLHELMVEHRPTVRDLFRSSRLADLGVVDIAALRAAIDTPSQVHSNSVALATCMELWLRSSWS